MLRANIATLLPTWPHHVMRVSSEHVSIKMTHNTTLMSSQTSSANDDTLRRHYQYVVKKYYVDVRNSYL